MHGAVVWMAAGGNNHPLCRLTDMDYHDLAANEQRLQQARRYWDAAAATFDDEPDHGLQDTGVRQAWVELLTSLLPTQRAAILDVGCGTGSLSLILAELGHQVVGIDLSAAMIALAQAKSAEDQPIEFYVMNAAAPQFPSQSFDVIVCRHLLWTLPDLPQIVQRWSDLLKPAGRMILIEGFWHTGGGLHAPEVVAALPASLARVSVRDLSSADALWGKPVADERYAVVASQA
jgi:2-polyprenyl-3-methyl-5-hydroxy-6-metoxy-1,4-benzoquinol methylase